MIRPDFPYEWHDLRITVVPDPEVKGWGDRPGYRWSVSLLDRTSGEAIPEATQPRNAYGRGPKDRMAYGWVPYLKRQFATSFLGLSWDGARVGTGESSEPWNVDYSGGITITIACMVKTGPSVYERLAEARAEIERLRALVVELGGAP